MKKQILNEEFRRMQKLAGLITEDVNFNLLQFIKDNQDEIAKKLKVDSLKDISKYSGNVSATIVIKDHTMVSEPTSTFQLDGETYKMKDVLANPKKFIGKTVMFRHNKLSKLEKKKIGKIEDGAVGFPEKRTTGTDIDFSTKPFTSTNDEESQSGKIVINNEPIYYIKYNV